MFRWGSVEAHLPKQKNGRRIAEILLALVVIILLYFSSVYKSAA